MQFAKENKNILFKIILLGESGKTAYISLIKLRRWKIITPNIIQLTLIQGIIQYNSWCGIYFKNHQI